MSAVTLLAHSAEVCAPFGENRIMKRMFRLDVFVAGLTLDGGDLFFVRNIIRVESGVAGNANECFMRGMNQYLVVHV